VNEPITPLFPLEQLENVEKKGENLHCRRFFEKGSSFLHVNGEL
jgi:hypothetical protein